LQLLDGSNYYEILGIASDALAIDIKKAYFTAVRKYPPERFPEEFKKIREAYDTLFDPDSKLEYDSDLESEGFGRCYEEANDAYDKGEYDKALELVTKALDLFPGNKIARNLMGFCFMAKKEYNKVVALYKKLIIEFPGTCFYYCNLGEALLEKGARKQAIEAFENALRLDRTNAMSWSELSSCLILNKNFEKARQVLENGIKECGESISLCMKLIHVDIYQKDMEKLVRDILRLEKLAKTDGEMQENVAWSFVEIAKDLMKDMPDFAAKLLERAKKLNPEEKEIKALHKDASTLLKLQGSLERLKKDSAVHYWLKDIIVGIVSGFNSSREELDSSICERLILRDPTNMLSSLKHIKLEYPELFKQHNRFFQKVLDNPTGSKVNEKELLADMRYIQGLSSMVSEQDQITVDDVYIPPMQRINNFSTGRNDPCPCGSGKKYKKCCGK